VTRSVKDTQPWRNPMDQSLPTEDLVRAEVSKFDRDNELPERALKVLIEHFPENTDRAHILLKVVAINRLYATNIFDVYSVVNHIAERKIDTDLKAGSIQLVGKMAWVPIGDKKRNNLSFASKYCSWHRPDCYPIYDSRAEACLWAYHEEIGLRSRKELWEYESYFEAVKRFRDRFELGKLSFKDIDKFLYHMGNALIEAKKQAKKAGKQAPV
jgi:hypothetical protein